MYIDDDNIVLNTLYTLVIIIIYSFSSIMCVIDYMYKTKAGKNIYHCSIMYHFLYIIYLLLLIYYY